MGGRRSQSWGPLPLCSARLLRTVLVRAGRTCSAKGGEPTMARYVIQRTFPDGLNMPMGDEGRKVIAGVVENNAAEGVNWVHSYVSDDDRSSFCVYDAPSPEAIRRVAERNGLPVDAITEVR